MTLRLLASSHSKQSGFSLVELIVAAAMLLVVLSSLASIFVSTNRHTAATRLRYEQESAIDEDLAVITRRNEHYTCASDPCSVKAVHPLKTGYFPVVEDTDASRNAIQTFEQLCKVSGEAGSLESALIDNIRAIPQPTDVWRSVSSDGIAHRYTIRYSTGRDGTGEILRQASFVPTSAWWCPDIP